MTEPSSPHHSPASEGRQRVLAAARPLFVEFGYKGVSMQQIADAAGIHKATLYHHFRAKDDLFAAVVHLELRQMRAEMVLALDNEDSTAARLAAVAWTFFRHSHADFGQLMSDVHMYLPQEVRQQIVREQAFPWDQLEDMFRQFAREGELPDFDTDLAVGLFAGVVWGQIGIRKVGRVTEPLSEDLAHRLVRILLAGLGASPAALMPVAATVAPD